jgi:uncharacterized protein (DUF2267 family)
MSDTGVGAFDRTMQKTHIWLNAIMNGLSVDRETAYSALRATLHTLRDRLPIEAAVHLGAQLPMLVRGMFYEGYKPSSTPVRERRQEEFLERLRLELKRNDLDVAQVARIVFGVMGDHVTEGEAQHVREILPRPVRELWPEVS